MYISSICALLSAQTNTSWLKKVTEATLTKEFMQEHQLSGSPKLSKQLVRLGMHPDYVSLLLGSKTKVQKGYKLWVKEQPDVVVRLQGNSDHWYSCQAVHNPEDLSSWSGGSYCSVKDDLLHYASSELMFITYGDSILESDKGWISRAKLRKIYAPDGTQHLYLDRVYGNTQQVTEAAMEIAAQQQCNLYINNYTNLPNAKLWGWTMPSSHNGYQDSKYWSTSSIQIGDNANTLLQSAYLGRSKNTPNALESWMRRTPRTPKHPLTVYMSPLTSVQYNPQNNEFKFELEIVRSLARETKKSPRFVEILGVLDASWSNVTEPPEFYDNKEYHKTLAIGDYIVRKGHDNDLYLVFKDINGSIAFITNEVDLTPEMYISINLPSQGYAEAENPCNLKYSHGRTFATVIYDCPEYGWAAAHDLESYWEVTVTDIEDDSPNVNEEWNDDDYNYNYEDEYSYCEVAKVTRRVVTLNEPEYGFAVAIPLP